MEPYSFEDYYIMSAHPFVFGTTMHIGTNIASHCITLSHGHVVCWQGSMGSQISHVGLATPTTTRHHSIHHILYVSSRLETWLCKLPTHGTSSFRLVLRFYSSHASSKIATHTSIQTVTIYCFDLWKAYTWIKKKQPSGSTHFCQTYWHKGSSPLTDRSTVSF